MPSKRNVMITGGAGYVGAVLVPKLLERGHRVTVLDLFLYGDDVFDGVSDKSNLTLVKGDLRDRATVEKALQGCDTVIHLACISNDPSFELDPDLGRSINYDAFTPLVELSRDTGMDRFIYASSSSVYGIKDEENVTEDLPLQPLTDYSKYKALCEEILAKYQRDSFTTVTIRPATVCGYSPRQRLDLAVNILTNHAVNNGRIRVFGGSQRRPNIHIADMVELYAELLELPKEKIAGKVWNIGCENHRMSELAEIVRENVSRRDVEIVTEPTDDLRSYHISSARIKNDIGFETRLGIADAVSDLDAAFQDGRLPNPMTDKRYYNIKTMQAVNLK